MADTRVAVTLGSGGARGYAHIGILEVLDERGYEVVGLAGTSTLVAGRRIEDLPVPFTAVATDLLARREVRWSSRPKRRRTSPTTSSGRYHRGCAPPTS